MIPLPTSQANLAKPKAAIIVAHPDDETLWTGGFVLEHPNWEWFVASLCCGNDPDRAPKFALALEQLGVSGAMADLDDGLEQTPLAPEVVQRQILALLPPIHFDLILTHGQQGEATWQRRPIEVHRAVTSLWLSGRLATDGLWLFAYADSEAPSTARRLPSAEPAAHFYHVLPEPVWQTKYALITEAYGFTPSSWEARTTPRAEAFWCFTSPAHLEIWLQERDQGHENPAPL